MRPIPGWSTLKELMRSRFVPSSYTRDLYNRLARLVQGGRSVEEYHKEMEMIIARANIEEDDDRKMARFLGGLNLSISEELELYEYHTMEELVQKAMKIERRLKRRALIAHPRPYKLQWFNDGGEVKVFKQVKVPFSIGWYQNEVLCDVVPMQAGHLLLGRLWQYDRRVMHNGYSNRYSFTYKGRNVVLAPLSPQEVYEEQKKLLEREKEFSASMSRKNRICFLQPKGIPWVGIMRVKRKLFWEKRPKN